MHGDGKLTLLRAPLLCLVDLLVPWENSNGGSVGWGLRLFGGLAGVLSAWVRLRDSLEVRLGG
jgi:hypothetical protein